MAPDETLQTQTPFAQIRSGSDQGQETPQEGVGDHPPFEAVSVVGQYQKDCQASDRLRVDSLANRSQRSPETRRLSSVPSDIFRGNPRTFRHSHASVHFLPDGIDNRTQIGARHPVRRRADSTDPTDPTGCPHRYHAPGAEPGRMLAKLSPAAPQTGARHPV